MEVLKASYRTSEEASARLPQELRCHHGSHATSEGATITQDCNTCHEPLAMDESSPEILKTLGIADRLAKMQKQ